MLSQSRSSVKPNPVLLVSNIFPELFCTGNQPAMGRSDYGTCTQCIRITFVGCNAFFIVLSIIGFAIGVWGVASGNNYDVITGSDSVSSSAILLTSSIISFGLCAAGIIGGIYMWRPFLIVYAIVLGIIVLLEFISAILAFVYSDRAGEILRENFEDAIERYRVSKNDTDYESNVNEAVEEVQKNLRCCGIDNATDWVIFNRKAVVDNGLVPPGRCTCNQFQDDCVRFVFEGVPTQSYVWEDGCLETLETFAKAYGIATGVVSLIVMFIEIAFVGIAIGLAVTIMKTVQGKSYV